MKRKLFALLLILAIGILLPSCGFLMDEFFTLGKTPPDLAKLTQRLAGQ